MFWGILIGAVLVRCISFGRIPDGVNQDEAMAAVDGLALAKYGTDRYGTFMPVHLEAWKYGQMSALLSYCMIPFIKVFGFHAFSVRLPLLLASCGSVVLMYLIGKKLSGTKFGLLAMTMTAVNPWHFMQSRWSLDCNLFPHVFLLAFYLLLCGFEKKRYLYLSMFFFGLTFYCYGIAAYAVTPFLVVFAGWCLWKKRFRIREVLLSIVIFSLTALPEIIVLLINRYRKPTIETPFFTMSFFPESIRSEDILFLNFSFEQLWSNISSMVKTVFLQLPDQAYNALPAFGPLYHLSIPFIVVGIVVFTRELFREKEIRQKTFMLALWGTLVMGIWVGLVTVKVNINRINIIFLPLIFMCCYGILWVLRRFRKLKIIVAGAYTLCSILFFTAYFTQFAKESREFYYGDFLAAVKEADSMEEFDRVYITGDLGMQFNQSGAEILTQFACEIDALYYQEKTNITGGRELDLYYDRYHFVDLNYPLEKDAEGIYVLHESELDKVPFAYSVKKTQGSYAIITGKEAEQ